MGTRTHRPLADKRVPAQPGDGVAASARPHLPRVRRRTRPRPSPDAAPHDLPGPRRGEASGVFDELHRLLLAKLNAANRIDWSRAAMDGSHIDAKKGVLEQARRRSTGASPAPSIT